MDAWRSVIMARKYILALLFALMLCASTYLRGEEPKPTPLPTSTEGLLEEEVRVSKEEVELLETFKTEADVKAGRAKWATLKDRLTEINMAMAKLPEPDEKEKARLISKHGPTMEQFRKRTEAVEKRLPILAKLSEELIEASVKARIKA
jgi:hypothetical protein